MPIQLSRNDFTIVRKFIKFKPPSDITQPIYAQWKNSPKVAFAPHIWSPKLMLIFYFSMKPRKYRVPPPTSFPGSLFFPSPGARQREGPRDLGNQVAFPLESNTTPGRSGPLKITTRHNHNITTNSKVTGLNTEVFQMAWTRVQ